MRPADKELARIGTLCGNRSAEACRCVAARRGTCVLEQPWPKEGKASLLNLPEVRALLELPGMIDVQTVHCAFGADAAKPTALRGNALIAPLAHH